MQNISLLFKQLTNTGNKTEIIDKIINDLMVNSEEYTLEQRLEVLESLDQYMNNFSDDDFNKVVRLALEHMTEDQKMSVHKLFSNYNNSEDLKDENKDLDKPKEFVLGIIMGKDLMNEYNPELQKILRDLESEVSFRNFLLATRDEQKNILSLKPVIEIEKYIDQQLEAFINIPLTNGLDEEQEIKLKEGIDTIKDKIRRRDRSDENKDKINEEIEKEISNIIFEFFKIIESQQVNDFRKHIEGVVKAEELRGENYQNKIQSLKEIEKIYYQGYKAVDIILYAKFLKYALYNFSQELIKRSSSAAQSLENNTLTEYQRQHFIARLIPLCILDASMIAPFCNEEQTDQLIDMVEKLIADNHDDTQLKNLIRNGKFSEKQIDRLISISTPHIKNSNSGDAIRSIIEALIRIPSISEGQIDKIMPLIYDINGPEHFQYILGVFKKTEYKFTESQINFLINISNYDPSIIAPFCNEKQTDRLIGIIDSYMLDSADASKRMMWMIHDFIKASKLNEEQVDRILGITQKLPFPNHQSGVIREILETGNPTEKNIDKIVEIVEYLPDFLEKKELKKFVSRYCTEDQKNRLKELTNHEIKNYIELLASEVYNKDDQGARNDFLNAITKIMSKKDLSEENTRNVIDLKYAQLVNEDYIKLIKGLGDAGKLTKGSVDYIIEIVVKEDDPKLKVDMIDAVEKYLTEEQKNMINESLSFQEIEMQKMKSNVSSMSI